MNDRADDTRDMVTVMRLLARALNPMQNGAGINFLNKRATELERAASLSAQETEEEPVLIDPFRDAIGGTAHVRVTPPADYFKDRPEMGGERAIYQDGARTGGAGDSTFSGKQRTAVDGVHGQANADLPNGPRLPPDALVQDDLRTTLMRFYGVATVDELISAQDEHVKKLQEKLPTMRRTFPGSYRHG